MTRGNFYLVFAVLVCVSVPTGVLAFPIISDDEGYDVPNDTVQCVNDLIAWCDGMDYPQQGAGMSIVSITVLEPGGSFRAQCVADFEGTNCTREGHPWFSCSEDNEFAYKGQVLSNNSADGTDDDICRTADRAFNDLFVQNLSYANDTIRNVMEKSMESFIESIAAINMRIDAIQNRLFGNWFPFGRRDYPILGSSERGEAERELERE